MLLLVVQTRGCQGWSVELRRRSPYAQNITKDVMIPVKLRRMKRLGLLETDAC